MELIPDAPLKKAAEPGSRTILQRETPGQPASERTICCRGALLDKHLTLRAGLDETSTTAGLTLTLARYKLDAGYVHYMGIKRVANLLGAESQSVDLHLRSTVVMASSSLCRGGSDVEVTRYRAKQSENRRAYRCSGAVEPGRGLVETARRRVRADGDDAQLSGIATVWPTTIIL
jgi:hypothetical protein